MRSALILSLFLIGCQGTADEPGPNGVAVDNGIPDDNGISLDGGAVDSGLSDAAPPITPDECEVEPGRRLLRRLSHVEYQNTVRDLLHVDVDVRAMLTPDQVVHGFDNNAEALKVSALLGDQYRALAEHIAELINPGALTACRTTDNACALDFIATMGQRLFRRPLTADDQMRYLDFYRSVAADEGFDAGIRWLIAALLQSPHFLYRTELGRRTDDGFELTSFELATGLSYLVWQTTPDNALLNVAKTGDLLDPVVFEAQIARLLADEQSAVTMAAFTEQWLGIDQLPNVSRDVETYPSLSPQVRMAMTASTARFIRELWRSGGSLADLFEADHGWLNPALAEHLDVQLGDGPESPEGLLRTSLVGTQYGGILTHPSVLTTFALSTTSSPIHRGLFVRERFLCQDLPPPPANLDTSPPAVDPSLSTRERYAQHALDPACAGCHSLMDPIGFAFEHFDGSGRWRQMDGQHAIDASGSITGTHNTNADFEGLDTLATVLAQSRDVEQCYIRQWVRFGYGTEHAFKRTCDMQRLADQMDDSLASILPTMVQTPYFTMRDGEDGELDVPGGHLVPTEPGGMVEPPPVVEPPPDEPDPESDVSLMVTEQSRWDTGYCADGVVTNQGDVEVVWAVETDVEGTVYNMWNAVRSGDSGQITIQGLDWNAVIGPGQEARFGFCANL